VPLPENDDALESTPNSLTDLLNLSLQNLATGEDPSDAAAIPLPSLDGTPRTSSLEILEAYDERRLQEERFREKKQRLHDRYLQAIQFKLEGLPRLNNVIHAQPQANVKEKIICYDFSRGGPPQEISLMALFMNPLQVSSEVVTRIVVMEGMDIFTLAALGDAFKVDPKFFEAHLNGSGYGEALDEDDGKFTAKWQSRTEYEHFRSIRWLRPVSTRLFIDATMRRRIIKKEEPELPCIISPICRSEKHKASTERTIFRRFHNLSLSSESLKKGFIPGAWEERLSIWRLPDHNCTVCKTSLQFTLRMSITYLT
jgi:hypothetical protein